MLVLAGIVILLYPIAATTYNNIKQREFSEQYGNQVQEVPHEDLDRELAEARAYNDTIEGIPILDPWLLKVAEDPGSVAYRAYASQLDRFDAMAQIKVPSVNIDLPIYHGTTDDVLAKEPVISTAPRCRSVGWAPMRFSPVTPACRAPPSSTT